MKLKQDYILRQLSDEYIVVPTKGEQDRLQGIISLSSSGAFLWKLLQSEQTYDSLTTAITEKYDVDEDTAKNAVKDFIYSIEKIGCMEN